MYIYIYVYVYVYVYIYMYIKSENLVGKKIFSVNNSKIIQGKLNDNNISTKSSKTKPDTIAMYVCGNWKNPKRVTKTKQKWIII